MKMKVNRLTKRIRQIQDLELELGDYKSYPPANDFEQLLEDAEDHLRGARWKLEDARKWHRMEED